MAPTALYPAAVPQGRSALWTHNYQRDVAELMKVCVCVTDCACLCVGVCVCVCDIALIVVCVCVVCVCVCRFVDEGDISARD